MQVEVQRQQRNLQSRTFTNPGTVAGTLLLAEFELAMSAITTTSTSNLGRIKHSCETIVSRARRHRNASHTCDFKDGRRCRC